jgi:hypothetical protein
MSDDAPTLPLPSVDPAPQPQYEPPAPRRAGVIAAFVILSVLVVAAIVVLVVVLVSRSASISPLAAATSSASSSTTQIPPAPKPTTVPAPSFTSLQPDAQEQDCFRGGDHRGRGPGKHGGGNRGGRGGANPTITVSWQTANADQVWIAEGSGDAVDSHGMRLAAAGNEGDFPNQLTFDCTQRSESFTMTLVGYDGAHVSRSWTVVNTRLNRF